ncbi:hypothetical protein [Pelagibius sp. 7325]|uniref:hypothetical protein n=1 Tax=Pelagibius sp. 7325 TaxID=3131994 RepID=UPI0030EC1FD9
MICVLRIGGATVDPAAVVDVLKLEPYRVDTPGQDGAEVVCLHYNVGDEDSPNDLVSKIEEFLSGHAERLAALSRLDDVEFRILDIGLMLDDNKVMVSIDLGETLIHRLSEFRLSLSVATYLSDSRS